MKARLDKIREILVYLVIIFLPVMSVINVFGRIKINMALSDAFAALIILLTLIDYKSFSFRKNFPYWWYFAGLMGLMIISNTMAHFNPDIVSGSILSALNEFIKFAIAGVYFFIGYNCLRDEVRSIKLLEVWVYTALAVSILGIVIMINTDIGILIHPNIPIVTLEKRFVGTLTDPNLAASYLGISFYLSLLFMRTVNNKVKKVIGIFVSILLIVSIILTQSRSGIISFCLSMFIFFILHAKKAYRYISILVLLVIIGYYGILDIDAHYFDKQISNSLSKRFTDVIEVKGETINRLNLSKAAIHMGEDHILFGVGRGNYTSNSEQYYEELGIDTSTKTYKNYFSKLIPHNTYMTFFAELGIIGLILFTSILLLALMRILKVNKLLACLLVFYLVQAIAINLENFRVIWFVLGLVCITPNDLLMLKSNKSSKSYDISNRVLMLSNICLLILGGVIYLGAVPHYTKPVEISDKLYIKYIDNLDKNRDYVLRYEIDSNSSNNSAPTMQIGIYSLDDRNREQLLNQIVHYDAKGYVNLIFSTRQDTDKVKLEAKPIGKSGYTAYLDNIIVAKLETGVGYIVPTHLKYAPEKLGQFLLSTHLVDCKTKLDLDSLRLFSDKIISVNNQYKNNNPNEKSTFYDGREPINIADKVLFLGSKISYIDSGQAKIVLLFKCIENMDKDYNISMHARTIDSGILSQNNKQYGYNSWDIKANPKTSEWITNELYSLEYLVDVNPGQYYLSFGFWTGKWVDGNSYKLLPSIELGYIQLR